MGRRLNTSTPTVINTELVPLDESFFIDAIGETEQWYYDNSNQYKPNRTTNPLTLIPRVSVYDGDSKESYEPTLQYVRWYEKHYDSTQGAYVEAEITNETDSSGAEYVKVGNNLLVKKNVGYSHDVTIRCSAQYTDPRDNGVAYETGDSVTLITNRDATKLFPKLDVHMLDGKTFNPLVNVTENNGALTYDSEFRLKAVGDFSGMPTGGGTPYKVDPLGTEEIVPQNDTDGVVTVAPTIDIRYGDVVQYDQTFMRRQTGGGSLSTINGNKAYLQKVKGNTVKWNQIAYAMNNSAWANNRTARVTTTATSIVVSVSADGQSNYTGIRFYKVDYFVNTHKYYYAIFVNPPSDINMVVSLGATVTNALTANKYNRCCGIIKASGTDELSFYLTNSSGILAQGTRITYKNGIIIDLTEIFGANNEPATVADFESWLAANIGLKPYYPYNAGELIPVKMSAIKSVGFNLWDEQWEVGYINPSTGGKQNADDAIRSKNYIPVNPQTRYYIKTPYTANISRPQISFYDKSYTYVSFDSGSGGSRVFEVPSGAYYMKFACGTVSPTYNNDICINISDATKNGTYEAYWSKTAPFDLRKVYGKLNGTGSMVQVFPDGMKKVGTVQDEIFVDGGVTKAIKRVGSVDLGTINYVLTYADTYHCFQAQDVMTNGTAAIRGGIPAICDALTRVSWVTISGYETNGINKCFTLHDTLINSTGICIRDTSYSDAAAFKTAMNGVMLFYELATPLNYTDCMYSVDGGETFMPLDRIVAFEWYAISNNTEVKVETLPWYKNGQNTDVLTVDAMYSEDIRVILRAGDPSEDTLYPDKIFRNIVWRIPDVDANIQSDNGSAIRSDSKGMDFRTIVNARHNTLSDAVKKDNLRFNWKTRKDNSSQVTDLGWGQEKHVDKDTLKNAHLIQNSPSFASTLVYNEVNLLGAYEEVTLNSVAITENGETVYDRTL